MPTEIKSPDRRVQRTRDLLLDALARLLMERGYEQITIQHILDRAGVGRATFYTHFDSKLDLLVCSIGRLRDMLAAHARDLPGTRLGFSLAYFEHIHSHRAIYLHTVSRDDEITVEREFRRMLRELVQRDLSTRRTLTDVETLAVEFVVSAIWSTTVWWIDSGSTLTPLQINAYFEQLVFPGLNGILKGTHFT